MSTKEMSRLLMLPVGTLIRNKRREMARDENDQLLIAEPGETGKIIDVREPSDPRNKGKFYIHSVVFKPSDVWVFLDGDKLSDERLYEIVQLGEPPNPLWVEGYEAAKMQAWRIALMNSSVPAKQLAEQIGNMRPKMSDKIIGCMPAKQDGRLRDALRDARMVVLDQMDMVVQHNSRLDGDGEPIPGTMDARAEEQVAYLRDLLERINKALEVDEP